MKVIHGGLQRTDLIAQACKCVAVAEVELHVERYQGGIWHSLTLFTQHGIH